MRREDSRPLARNGKISGILCFGIDLAKSAIPVHGADEPGKAALVSQPPSFESIGHRRCDAGAALRKIQAALNCTECGPGNMLIEFFGVAETEPGIYVQACS